MLYYCSTYYVFCLKYGKTHILKEHNMNMCFEYNGITFVSYCSNHNKNY